MTLKYVSVAAFVCWVLVLVVLFMQESLLGSGPISAAVQVLAILNMIWVRFTFGVRSFHAAADPTAGGLVTTGPYKFVRHPIYASTLYFMWAGALSHLSMVSFSLAVVGTICAGVRMFAEESLLVVRYPEYVAYAAQTKRVIPFLI